MKVLTEYRAWLLRVVGYYQNHVFDEFDANCTASQQADVVKEQLRQLGLRFDQRLELLLNP